MTHARKPDTDPHSCGPKKKDERTHTRHVFFFYIYTCVYVILCTTSSGGNSSSSSPRKNINGKKDIAKCKTRRTVRTAWPRNGGRPSYLPLRSPIVVVAKRYGRCRRHRRARSVRRVRKKPLCAYRFRAESAPTAHNTNIRHNTCTTCTLYTDPRAQCV